ncbi:MerR family transcriptional regulator [Vibrio sp.]|uniref:MerR family transcriptional regulator n=1 Tax=Vibrio sp. TaxID=678 RepID=UPI003D0B793D
MACEGKYYAIRQVAELTGVKPVTLRAWQRRYNLLKPHRSEKGHRLYSQQDIDTIVKIQSWLAKGVSIGRVKDLLNADSSLQTDETTPVRLDEVEQCLMAVSRLDTNKVANIVNTVFKEYPLRHVEQQFILPLLDTLEQVKRPYRALHKSLLHNQLLVKIWEVMRAETKAARGAPCLLVSLEPGCQVLVWLWALNLIEQGMKVTVLEGVDDLSALDGHPGLEHYQHLALFASRTLNEAQLLIAHNLAGQYPGRIYLSQVLEMLCADEILNGVN